MKTKTKKPGFQQPLPGFKESPADAAEREIKEAQAAPAEPAPGARKERFAISFDLNDDGSPDLSSMRDTTKKRVQEFFGDSRMAAAFGAKPAVPAVEVINPFMVASLYNLLGAVEAAVFGSYMKIPEPIAKQAFTYTPAEVNALTGPTVRVINKHAADWMIKWQDEIALSGMLLTMTVAKITYARAMAKTYVPATVQPASQVENEETDKKTGVM